MQKRVRLLFITGSTASAFVRPGKEVLVQLAREIVALLDELNERHGLRNHSRALMQLIERGRATAQQMT
jgi:hypothetical protein